jgi:hydroxypyruvate isomerase
MLEIVANISTLFHELPMLERFRAAREAGFDGVEPPRFRCRESIQVLIERHPSSFSILGAIVCSIPVVDWTDPPVFCA